MIIKEVRHAVGRKHVGVAGTLVCDGHLLPFRYRVDLSADPAVHSQKLDEHHRRGCEWVARRQEFLACIGLQISIGSNGEVATVTDCDLQAWAHHDWRLHVAWTESGQRKSLTWRYTQPSAAMSAITMATLIGQDIQSRAALNPQGQAHGAAIASIRAASRG